MAQWMYALLPLAWLLFLAVLACLLGFGLLQAFGDVLPLNKTISKLTLILLLLGAFPLRKKLHFSWADLGFASPARFMKQMGLGLSLALVTLIPVILIEYALEVLVWDEGRQWSVGNLLGRIGLGLLLSLLIGLGEEFLFRGLLLGSLRRRFSVAAAVGISAFYYAALHFLKSYTQIPFEEQTLASGFMLMAEAFTNWANPRTFSALLALFVVGVFLAVIRIRVPQSLGLCMGCHAGWVWQIKLSKDFYNVNQHSDYLYLINSAYDGVIGPMVAIWLTVALFVWLRFCVSR
ncbi:MAG: CPBP family intramembrane glutamic endopeptidase [Gammaproteobacteria bacterium]